MATLTAVAAGGNWSSASTWSPAQVPTAADDCRITATMTGTVTIDGTVGSPNHCRSLVCTGLTHTLTINGVLNIGTSTSGALTFVSGMTFNFNSGTINFVSTTTGNNITTAGKNMGILVFNGAGGSWTLQDNLTAGTISLTAGTLNAGAKTVSLASFESNNSNTRALTMSGSWSVLNGLPAWDISTSTGMTLTATGSTLTFNSDTLIFNGGGLTYANIIVTPTGGTSPQIHGANTFANFTYNGSGTSTDSIIFYANQTVTGTFTLKGIGGAARLLIQSDVIGTSRTLTSATNSMAYVDIQNITGAGASGWNLSAITGGSGDCGGNSGITFTSPINCYWKANGGNWSGANWYTTSGGSTATRVPLVQDTAIFDANSFTTTFCLVDLDTPRISGMYWSTVTNTPILQNRHLIVHTSVYRSVRFGAMETQPYSFTGQTFTFANQGSINVDSAGIDLQLGDIIFNGGGIIHQTGDFFIFYSLSVTNGIWNNDAHAFSTNGFNLDGGTFNLGSGSFGCGILAMSAGLLEMNGNPMSMDSANISGGIINLSGQLASTGTGTTIVSGGTINDTGPNGELYAVASITFSGGTSVVRKITSQGPVQIESTASVTLTGSASWGPSDNWTVSGSGCTFITVGTATWSSNSISLANGGSWTFC